VTFDIILYHFYFLILTKHSTLTLWLCARAHARFEQRVLQGTIINSATPLLQRQHSGTSTVVTVSSPSPGRTTTAMNHGHNSPTATFHVSTTKAMSGINSNPSNVRKPPRMASVDERNRHPPQLYRHTALQDTVHTCMLTSLYICAFAHVGAIL